MDMTLNRYIRNDVCEDL